MQENERTSTFFKKYVLFYFPGKTRFFQLPSGTATWEKVLGIIGNIVALYFGGGVILIPWYLFGVIYYRVKYPSREGGL